MKLSQFRFDLPLNLIAQNPTKRREDSRMMVVDRKTGHMENKHFKDILEYFDDKDVFVVNNTKVFPEKIPLLKIHGATLTFTNSSKKCIITVHTFEDAIQLAEQQTFYDLKFMKDYGTTIIGVVYFPEGE